MDQSYSESDVSLSPSKIYERLQMLRQLQLMQRGRLHKLCLQYQHSPEMSSSATEIVSHFSNSTSYNTFRSLLQSSQDTPRALDSNYQANVSPGKDHEQDYIEGVSALNLSQESEFIANSPLSANSRVSANSRSQRANNTSETNENLKLQPTIRNQISLDEMPILSPRKDFEELIIEKLKNETNIKNRIPANVQPAPSNTKRPFLRRGEGMSRFGLKKNNLVIQNTKSLPWRKNKPALKNSKSDVTSKTLISPLKQKEQANGQILVSETKEQPSVKHVEPKLVDPKSHSALTPPNLASNKQEFKQASNKQEFKQASNKQEFKQSSNKQEFKLASNNQEFNQASNNLSTISTASEPNNNKPIIKTQKQNSQHPLKSTKGQTWATVLTKEQENFLRELKQSDYYKNFVSPAKSIVSDASCDGVLSKLQQERETAEQNMFELLENKVAHESFNIENSFFNRFIRKSNLECSGESTPLVMQRCLYENPNLLNLHQSQSNRCRNDNSCTDAETCSDYTDCSETCSSVSTCCSCKKGEPTRIDQSIELSDKNEKVRKEVDIHVNKKNNEICQNDTVKNDNGVNVEMAEMNAKLIATSEILKDRLRELEDEIDTFRKENTNLSKMREELDLERQKFYEDKSAFEQKYNEEKILSEYYIAEEKEKLNKQKQVYERYVREMRGRLNKKEKDEVINLKKEIAELKEDIRMKDAKSTSTIARLRNQIKIMEKEKKNLQDEVEKLKKENRRIQHSNDITRRLTNLKYLEQINNKLTRMSSKGAQSEADLDRDIKYKAFEIERQSRCKKVQSVINPRRRSKSVPNLNVTSRYAKYFSQKDSISDKDSKLKGQYLDKTSYSDDDGVDDSDKELQNDDMNNFDVAEVNESDDENNLEKIYNERFQSSSVNSKTSSHQDSPNVSPRYTEKTNGNDGFFIQKSTSNRSSKSISKNSLSPFNLSESSSSNNSKSPASILSHKSYRRSKSPINIAKNATVTSDYETNGFTGNAYHNRSKSPVSILSNRTSSHRAATVLNKDLYSDKRMIVSPEPSSSRTSISKTNLNPTEFRKPDGSKELRFPNGNVKHISADGKYSKFVYYNGDVKENFYNEGRIKYFYAETKTYHTTHADGLEVLEFSDGQIEKRYKDGSSEIRLPNGSVRYFDPKNEHVREEWRFPDGAALTVSATGEQRIVFSNGQVEVHAKDHKRREFPDGTVKLVYNDGTSETRYASGRVRIKDKHGNLIMDSASG